MPDPEKDPASPPSPLRGCLFQLLWSMLGPGFLFIAGALSVVEKRPVGSAADWLLLAVVIACIAARFLDPTVREATGKPGEGGPPSPGKYAAWVAGGGVLVFVFAHFVAPRVF